MQPVGEFLLAGEEGMVAVLELVVGEPVAGVDDGDAELMRQAGCVGIELAVDTGWVCGAEGG